MPSKAAAKQKKSKPFVHLHLHTEYSLLDGLTKIKELVALAKEWNIPAVAATDHGAMYGVAELFLTALGEGVKPIAGLEAYIVEDMTKRQEVKVSKKESDDTKWFYHLTLLAQNKQGYTNLVHLTSEAFLKGFYYKPLIDKKLLAKRAEGLIALSGCGGGEIAHSIIVNAPNKDKAIKAASPLVEEYLKIFGKDRFFIELQRKTMGEPELEKFLEEVLLALADKYKLKIVATNDVHYLKPEDADVQAIIMALRQGKKLKQGEAFTLESDQLYYKSPQEMWELFSDLPEALENTLYIADMIEEYTIVSPNRVQPPYYDLPKGKTAKEFLREKAYEGAKRRYGKITKELKERLDYELSVIDQKGYNEYFLVVADYVNWAKRQGILVGPGRGSGGGSVVAYTLGITDIDPLEWGLLFDRFLNPYRPSPPDFDVDFQDNRRDEVIDYVRRKYGSQNVAAIAAIGRMDTRAAFRDVARVLDIPLNIVDKFTKLIPVKRGKPMPIEEAIETIPELKELIKQYPDLQRVVNVLKRIKKLARHVSVHACGYLVTPKPIVEYIPVRFSPQNPEETITQIEGKYIEDLNLMKFDFLGLRTLTIISHTLDAIKETQGKTLTLEEIYKDKQNPVAFKVYQKAETDGVFQLESQGMKAYLKQIHPTTLEDINFLLAAYRPGPMKYIPAYIRRKFGKEPVTYVHPDLKPILESTYGFAIYQEQILRIAVDIAGYTVGEADILRRAIGKKKLELLKKEKKRFFEGAQKRGYPKEVVEKIWEFILPFADYGFNKSHSAAYTIISYYTAYLKGNYPVEFIYGLLTTDLDRPARLEKDLEIAQKMGISLLPPDINLSNQGFKIEYVNKELESKWLDDDFPQLLAQDKAQGGKGVLGEIRIGFKAVKGVSSKTVEAILEARAKGEFRDLQDFMERIDTTRVDKKSLILLAKVGTFDRWGERAALIRFFEERFDQFRRKKGSDGQLSLLGTVVQTPKVELPPAEPVGLSQILQWEKEAYGVYITSHPLTAIKEFLASKKAVRVKDVLTRKSRKIKVAGFVGKIKKYTTKNGEVMGFVDLQDGAYSLDVVLFPKIYERFSKQVVLKYDLNLVPIIFEGYLEKKPGLNTSKQYDLTEYSFRAVDFEVIDFDTARNYQPSSRGTHKAEVRIPQNATKQDLVTFKKLLAQDVEGELSLYIILTSGKKVKYKKLVSKASVEAIREQLGWQVKIFD